jgi:hypothetical protein
MSNSIESIEDAAPASFGSMPGSGRRTPLGLPVVPEV